MTYAQERIGATSSRGLLFGFILLGHLGFFWSLNSGLASSSLAKTLLDVTNVKVLVAETLPELPPPPVPMSIVFEPPSVDQPVVIVAEPDVADARDFFAPDSSPLTANVREEPKQISPPASSPQWPFTPRYPPASQRLDEEGRVVLDVYVLDDGHVADVRVRESSGYARLDQAALEEVKRGWRLLPGTEDGKPTAMWVRLAVNFRLNRSG